MLIYWRHLSLCFLFVAMAMHLLVGNPIPLCIGNKTAFTVHCSTGKTSGALLSKWDFPVKILFLSGFNAETLMSKETWRYFPGLEVLRIENTALSHLDQDAFVGLEGTLRELRISGNLLSSFPVKVSTHCFRYISGLENFFFFFGGGGGGGGISVNI